MLSGGVVSRHGNTCRYARKGTRVKGWRASVHENCNYLKPSARFLQVSFLTRNPATLGYRTIVELRLDGAHFRLSVTTPLKIHGLVRFTTRDRVPPSYRRATTNSSFRSPNIVPTRENPRTLLDPTSRKDKAETRKPSVRNQVQMPSESVSFSPACSLRITIILAPPRSISMRQRLNPDEDPQPSLLWVPVWCFATFRRRSPKLSLKLHPHFAGQSRNGESHLLHSSISRFGAS